jgi:hypothetical protein
VAVEQGHADGGQEQLAVSGTLAWKRFGRVRVTILVVECAIALFSLINVVVEGVPTAGLGLVIAALVGRRMVDAPAREWFNR